jgi:hypothetical protein
MSSVASYNASDESPRGNPIQLPPQLAPMPTPIALSPCTIQTMLQAQPDINATLLLSIANGLLQTITNCETDAAITKKAYEDRIHHLEQCVLHYEDTFNHAPEGFMLNEGKSATSTSQWATGCIKRQNGSASMMMAQLLVTMLNRG